MGERSRFNPVRFSCLLKTPVFPFFFLAIRFARL